MAVLLNPTNAAPSRRVGTLAVVPLAGGAPRPLLEHVQGADWSPDGNDLAVVRRVENQWRLEYPSGRVLYTADFIFSARVSPRGDRIAFIEEADSTKSASPLIRAEPHANATCRGSATPTVQPYRPMALDCSSAKRRTSGRAGIEKTFTVTNVNVVTETKRFELDGLRVRIGHRDDVLRTVLVGVLKSRDGTPPPTGYFSGYAVAADR